MKPQFADSLSFSWSDLGDVAEGRLHLGSEVPVVVYRLAQYSLREAIAANFGEEVAGRMLREGGWIAGREFCRNVLDTSLAPAAFIDQLQDALAARRIGILRVESLDLASLTMTLTVSEDLDCSGLPVSGRTVCDYDEGFISGILYEYMNIDFRVVEIDCWATGDRTCRFSVTRETVES
ncbi:MAG: 4-vinyl reductase [bacterium]|nr:4-vinyl reductase [bacterium]